MKELSEITSTRPPRSEAAPELLEQYGCGPIRFSGHDDALYERHLMFDDVVDPLAAGSRERFEAAARSVRDVLSQRWVRTERTYNRLNPKTRLLSVDGVSDRSVIDQQCHQPFALPVRRTRRCGDSDLDWIGVMEEEPDAGLGNGGLGRLAACFLDSMATMQLPAMGYGLRYEYGMFKQTIEDGWQREHPDNWLRRHDPWEVARPQEAVEIKLGCIVRDARRNVCRSVPGRPSTLIGMPFDRPVVGYGGKTINTLRLWSAASHDYFDFQEFSSGDFVGALVGSLAASTLTRVLYPDDSTEVGQALRFVQEYFLVACSLADLVRRFHRRNGDWQLLPDKVAIQLNDTHPTLAVPELMRILLDEAHLGWDEAWDITQRTLAYTNHTLLPEALEKWPLALFPAIAAAPAGNHLRDQSPVSRRRCGPAGPGDEARVARMSLIEEGPERQSSNGEPGDRRLAQHQWRRRDPLGAVAQD